MVQGWIVFSACWATVKAAGVGCCHVVVASTMSDIISFGDCTVLVSASIGGSAPPFSGACELYFLIYLVYLFIHFLVFIMWCSIALLFVPFPRVYCTAINLLSEIMASCQMSLYLFTKMHSTRTAVTTLFYDTKLT